MAITLAASGFRAHGGLGFRGFWARGLGFSGLGVRGFTNYLKPKSFGFQVVWEWAKGTVL